MVPFITMPCVWVEVIPTQTCATTVANTYFPTIATGTTRFQVYQDGYGNLCYGQEADMTPQEYYNLARNRVEYYHTVTEIDRARIEATQEYYRRQEQERAQLAKVANNRAKELLLSHLTKKQRQTFEKNNWFIVHGGKTDTKYRIRTTSYSGNIDVFTGDKVTATLCCHCSDALPIHDHHLAQKIGLEWDEERFLKLANRRAA